MFKMHKSKTGNGTRKGLSRGWRNRTSYNIDQALHSRWDQPQRRQDWETTQRNWIIDVALNDNLEQDQLTQVQRQYFHDLWLEGDFANEFPHKSKKMARLIWHEGDSATR
jgi:hypothetical protein